VRNFSANSSGASAGPCSRQRLPDEVTGVELLGNAMVLFEQRLAIDVGELDRSASLS
jgi:hypothetical protein